ncbi:phage major capsid protein [Clostridium gasigenes]|uniref:phage major capsid protein n=1 Tax=Clostridium gasigenes TaxID=94869 RepID=UPI00162586EF|nr:phage major capsid protein [Clostridium gasigenes]MBB6622564.1 phage major capsid protein [Clostridium gasigenes]
MNKNLKAFIEKRASLVTKMEVITSLVETEVRAFTTDEDTEFDKIKAEIEGLDATITKLSEKRAANIEEEKDETEEVKKEERAQEVIDNEELRGIFSGEKIEKRADSMNSTTPAQGGLVINKVLTGAILKKLKDRSAVLSFFNSTSIPGVVKIPKKASSGTATWESEKTTPDPTPKSTVPTLEIIELGQNRLYRESAITQQMLNIEEIDLRGFIIDDISETMADTLEVAVFSGTGTKQPTGILGAVPIANQISLAIRGTLDIDYFKKCKAKLKKEAQKQARWFMQSDTLLEVDLIKDAQGRPLLQPNPTAESDYMILGTIVELTDAMPKITEAGANPLVLLAAPQAYHINTQKALSLFVYDDSTYKRAGLIGYGSDIFIDGKVKDDQYCASIVNKA